MPVVLESDRAVLQHPCVTQVSSLTKTYASFKLRVKRNHEWSIDRTVPHKPGESHSAIINFQSYSMPVDVCSSHIDIEKF